MPNGKPHDNPITDLLIHGMHPFPADVEVLVPEVHRRDPGVFNDLEWAPFDWEQGKNLDAARTLLLALVETHGDPNARREILNSYRRATSQ